MGQEAFNVYQSKRTLKIAFHHFANVWRSSGGQKASGEWDHQSGYSSRSAYAQGGNSLQARKTLQLINLAITPKSMWSIAKNTLNAVGASASSHRNGRPRAEIILQNETCSFLVDTGLVTHQPSWRANFQQLGHEMQVGAVQLTLLWVQLENAASNSRPIQGPHSPSWFLRGRRRWRVLDELQNGVHAWHQSFSWGRQNSNLTMEPGPFTVHTEPNEAISPAECTGLKRLVEKRYALR